MKDNKLNNIDNSGFKIPDDYFANLEDQVMSHIKIDEASGSGHKMPEDYLDNLENSILNKAGKEPQPKVISLFNKRNLIYISSVAAAIVLFFSIGIFNTPDPFSELDDELVENYILNEITDADLAELIENQEIDHTQFIDYNLNEDILDSYLQSADIEELITE